MIADYDAKVNYISHSFENFFNVKIEYIYNKNIAEAFNKYLTEFELKDLELSILNRKNWVKVISDINNDGDVQYKEIRLMSIKTI